MEFSRCTWSTREHKGLVIPVVVQETYDFKWVNVIDKSVVQKKKMIYILNNVIIICV